MQTKEEDHMTDATDASLEGGCLAPLVGMILLLAGVAGSALLIAFFAGWLVLGIAAAAVGSGVLIAVGLLVLLDSAV